MLSKLATAMLGAYLGQGKTKENYDGVKADKRR